jgi:hypothetical protein
LRTKTTEFNFLVAVFNKGGKNHKYVVWNNKKNKKRSR